MPSPIETYLTNIEADWLGGKATEHTYRPALATLLQTLAAGVKASNDPKHIACGAPDFVVERGQTPLGYVETKDVGADLDKVEKSDQLKRYRHSLNNLILTDYLEFRWYVSGDLKLTARLARLGPDKKLARDPSGIALAEKLFTAFYQTEVPTVATPQDLAERLARIAQFIRELIFQSLTANTDVEHDALARQYRAFQEHLLPALKTEEFADMYAQTMAYGLFAAKLSAPENVPFSRAVAYQYLAANRFLRKLFLDVGDELDGTIIAPHLDDVAALLARADMPAILKDFGKRTRTEDPVVHFYETFLATYDPKLREARGVYYTPEPVVQFIVRSVDQLLKTHFQRPMGLADPDVNVLDPATGTSTFLYFVIQTIHDTLAENGQGGLWQAYVSKDLLPRVYGFELLIAPYVIAHLKLSLLLRDLGYTFGKHDRLKVFLTNALDEGITRAETLGDLGSYISQEANEAAQVKQQTPIMVVLGNPPYSGHSANASKTADGAMNFIGKLVRDYYFVDGAPLGERNPKWLQDDYVKFIRFAQWRIEQTGHGIVAFVTNHGYLDNPTFRGMRQHLLQTFDEIFVLDLHGNSKKKERAPDGGPDENVFDIQQGVAILVAVKIPSDQTRLKPGLARLRHAELYGPRADKHKFLERHHVDNTRWKTLTPASPAYFFIPQNLSRRKEYEKGWPITDIMLVNSLGVTSARDDFAVAFERRTIESRIADFVYSKPTDAQLLAKYDIHDTRDWKIAAGRQRLRDNFIKERLQLFNYRPFDMRWTYYDEAFVERPRTDVMKHMLVQDNFAFVTIRRSREQGTWSFAFVGAHPIDKSFITSLDNAFVFPLYLYPNGDYPAALFDHNNGRRPNLADTFITAFSKQLQLTFLPDGQGDGKKTFGPEDVFHYAYAIFHSPAYRERYAEFLKIDFPRLPLTADKKLFAKLAAKGAELARVHLLQAPQLDSFITTFPVAGDNVVEQVRYEKKNVWLNATQYFGGVPEAVWEFQVGGYQVCAKWLKDRKGRALSTDDLRHYQRVVVALQETIRLMAEIDKVIPGWPLL